MRSADTASDALTTTGSKTLDLVTFGLLLLLLLVSAARLRVYHRITVMDIRVERLDPDGSTHAMDTPREVGARRLSSTTPDVALSHVSDLIRRQQPDRLVARGATAGTRFRWTIRYGWNSPRLSHATEIVVAP
jgi:hypothetical protein